METPADGGEIHASPRRRLPFLHSKRSVIQCNHTNHGPKDNHEVKDVRVSEQPAQMSAARPMFATYPSKPLEALDGCASGRRQGQAKYSDGAGIIEKARKATAANPSTKLGGVNYHDASRGPRYCRGR
jgi:hypothetical protein